MSTPFKMKGSPFQRNFGIGSPMKQTTDKEPKGYDPNIDYQREANQHYLTTGNIHNEGDAIADNLYEKMVWQSGTAKRESDAKKAGEIQGEKNQEQINKIISSTPPAADADNTRITIQNKDLPIAEKEDIWIWDDKKKTTVLKK